MKLQKQISRKVGNTEYAKWVIVLPPTEVNGLGWKDGQELEVTQLKGGLQLKPKLKE